MAADVHRASQHFVTSILLRLGHAASAVANDRGAVDVVLERAGAIQTIQVRGSVQRREWNVRAAPLLQPSSHFYVLLYWGELIAEPRTWPDLWVLPQSEIGNFTRNVPGLEPMVRVMGNRLQRDGIAFQNAWHLLGVPPAI